MVNTSTTGDIATAINELFSNIQVREESVKLFRDLEDLVNILLNENLSFRLKLENLKTVSVNVEKEDNELTKRVTELESLLQLKTSELERSWEQTLKLQTEISKLQAKGSKESSKAMVGLPNDEIDSKLEAIRSNQSPKRNVPSVTSLFQFDRLSSGKVEATQSVKVVDSETSNELEISTMRDKIRKLEDSLSFEQDCGTKLKQYSEALKAELQRSQAKLESFEKSASNKGLDSQVESLQSELDSLIISSNKELLSAKRYITKLEKEAEEMKAQLFNSNSPKGGDISIYIENDNNTNGILMSPSPFSGKSETDFAYRVDELEKSLKLKSIELETVWDRNLQLQTEVTKLKSQVPKDPSPQKLAPLPTESMEFDLAALRKNRSSPKKPFQSLFKSNRNQTDRQQEDQLEADILKLIDQNASLQAEIHLLSLSNSNISTNSGRLTVELEEALEAAGSELRILLDENSSLKDSVRLLEDALADERDSGSQQQLRNEALQSELQKSLQLIQDIDEQISSKALQLDELQDICRQYKDRANEVSLSAAALTSADSAITIEKSKSTRISYQQEIEALRTELESVIVSSNKELLAARRKISRLEKDAEERQSEIETSRSLASGLHFSLASEDESKSLDSSYSPLPTDTVLSRFSPRGDPLSGSRPDLALLHRLDDLEQSLKLKSTELETVWERNIQLHAEVTNLKSMLPKEQSYPKTAALGNSIDSESVLKDLAELRKKQSSKKRVTSVQSIFFNKNKKDEKTLPDELLFKQTDVETLIDQNAELQAEVRLLSLASGNQATNASRMTAQLEEALECAESEMKELLDENSSLVQSVQLLEGALSVHKEEVNSLKQLRHVPVAVDREDRRVQTESETNQQAKSTVSNNLIDNPAKEDFSSSLSNSVFQVFSPVLGQTEANQASANEIQKLKLKIDDLEKHNLLLQQSLEFSTKQMENLTQQKNDAQHHDPSVRLTNGSGNHSAPTSDSTADGLFGFGSLFGIVNTTSNTNSAQIMTDKAQAPVESQANELIPETVISDLRQQITELEEENKALIESRFDSQSRENDLNLTISSMESQLHENARRYTALFDELQNLYRRLQMQIQGGSADRNISNAKDCEHLFLMIHSLLDDRSALVPVVSSAKSISVGEEYSVSPNVAAEQQSEFSSPKFGSKLQIMSERFEASVEETSGSECSSSLGSYLFRRFPAGSSTGLTDRSSRMLSSTNRKASKALLKTKMPLKAYQLSTEEVVSMPDTIAPSASLWEQPEKSDEPRSETSFQSFEFEVISDQKSPMKEEKILTNAQFEALEIKNKQLEKALELAQQNIEMLNNQKNAILDKQTLHLHRNETASSPSQSSATDSSIASKLKVNEEENGRLSAKLSDTERELKLILEKFASLQKQEKNLSVQFEQDKRTIAEMERNANKHKKLLDDIHSELSIILNQLKMSSSSKFLHFTPSDDIHLSQCRQIGECITVILNQLMESEKKLEELREDLLGSGRPDSDPDPAHAAVEVNETDSSGSVMANLNSIFSFTGLISTPSSPSAGNPSSAAVVASPTKSFADNDEQKQALLRSKVLSDQCKSLKDDLQKVTLELERTRLDLGSVSTELSLARSNFSAAEDELDKVIGIMQAAHSDENLNNSNRAYETGKNDLLLKARLLLNTATEFIDKQMKGKQISDTEIATATVSSNSQTTAHSEQQGSSSDSATKNKELSVAAESSSMNISSLNSFFSFTGLTAEIASAPSVHILKTKSDDIELLRHELADVSAKFETTQADSSAVYEIQKDLLIAIRKATQDEKSFEEFSEEKLANGGASDKDNLLSQSHRLRRATARLIERHMQSLSTKIREHDDSVLQTPRDNSMDMRTPGHAKSSSSSGADNALPIFASFPSFLYGQTSAGTSDSAKLLLEGPANLAVQSPPALAADSIAQKHADIVANRKDDILSRSAAEASYASSQVKNSTSAIDSNNEKENESAKAHSPNPSLSFAMQKIEQLTNEISAQKTEQQKLVEQLTLVRDSSVRSSESWESNLQLARVQNERLSADNDRLTAQLTSAEKDLITANSILKDSKNETNLLRRTIEDAICEQQLIVRRMVEKGFKVEQLSEGKNDLLNQCKLISDSVEKIFERQSQLEANWKSIAQEVLDADIQKDEEKANDLISNMNSMFSLSGFLPSSLTSTAPSIDLTQLDSERLVHSKIREWKSRLSKAAGRDKDSSNSSSNINGNDDSLVALAMKELQQCLREVNSAMKHFQGHTDNSVDILQQTRLLNKAVMELRKQYFEAEKQLVQTADSIAAISKEINLLLPSNLPNRASINQSLNSINLESLRLLMDAYRELIKSSPKLVSEDSDSKSNADKLQKSEEKISELSQELASQRQHYEVKLAGLEESGLLSFQKMQQDLLATHSSGLTALAMELQTLLNLFQERDSLETLHQSAPSTDPTLTRRVDSLLKKTILTREGVAAKREMEASEQKIVDLEAHIGSLRSSISLLELEDKPTRDSDPSVAGTLTLLRDRFQSQYDNLTNIISDMSEERNKLLLQLLDMQMKCDFQQSQLVESQTELEQLRKQSTSRLDMRIFAAEEAAKRAITMKEATFKEEREALVSQIAVMKAMRMRKLKLTSQRLASAMNKADDSHG